MIPDTIIIGIVSLIIGVWLGMTIREQPRYSPLNMAAENVTLSIQTRAAYEVMGPAQREEWFKRAEEIHGQYDLPFEVDMHVK